MEVCNVVGCILPIGNRLDIFRFLQCIRCCEVRSLINVLSHLGANPLSDRQLRENTIHCITAYTITLCNPCIVDVTDMRVQVEN